MSASSWWTPADAAELDVLVHELVRVAFVHRERCSTCQPGQPWCDPLRDAFDSVLEWTEARELRSGAEWLRAERDRLEGRAA